MQVILLKRVGSLTHNDALDMEDFTATVQNEFKVNPYFAVGNKSKKIAMASVPVSEEAIDKLARVSEILAEIWDYKLLTNEDLNADILPSEMVTDAKSLIEKTTFNEDRAAPIVELKEPITDNKFWMIYE